MRTRCLSLAVPRHSYICITCCGSFWPGKSIAHSRVDGPKKGGVEHVLHSHMWRHFFCSARTNERVVWYRYGKGRRRAYFGARSVKSFRIMDIHMSVSLLNVNDRVMCVECMCGISLIYCVLMDCTHKCTKRPLSPRGVVYLIRYLVCGR